MQVVWEADTAAFANRKRAARACQQCQKRKKRCHHTFSRGQDRQAETEGLDKVLPNLTHKEPIRFVGDLNPESILTDLSTKPKDELRTGNRVSHWVENPRPQTDPQKTDEPNLTLLGQDEKIPCNIEKYAKVEGGRRILTGHQRNYLQAAGAFRLLPKVTQDALVTTYFACINAVLPIVDCNKLLREYAAGQASIFLIQAICMVACKTEEAAPFLKFSENGPLLDPIPFARSLHTGLDAAMKADLEPNRVTRIQILTLMHLHNDGPAGIEESSTHLSQAIHDAWTAGLHIQMPGRTSDDASSMLWWTLWSLDRLNACIGGRPVMIADRDIDIERPSLAPEPTLQLINVWLKLGDLLDEVIEYYRPTAEPNANGWETEFPTYAKLVAGIDVDILQEHSQTILEICYNIIAILSCRAGGPTTASYVRRITASDRIQQLLADGKHTQVTPLPLVPYACSLSLTVAYRDIRDQHKDPGRAKRDLATRCEFLESLSRYWWTADAMAKLGRKALKSLQQPGFRKQSVLNLANTMDGEVIACKYGPFESKRAKKKARTSSENQDDGNPENSQSDSGNALQMLSDAAAKHATTAKGSISSATGSGMPSKPSRLRGIPSSISLDGPLWSNRPNYQNYNFYGLQNSNMSSTNAMNAAFPSTVSHSHSMLPSLMPHPVTTPNSTISTPIPLDHRTSDSSAVPRTMPYFSAESTGTSTPSTMPFDPNVFDQYSYQFENLDNLFDGFFDLSLPTMFIDPLFDGAAYFNSMSATENMDMDVDMNMPMAMDPSGTGMMDMSGMNGAVAQNQGMGNGISLNTGLDLGIGAGMGINIGTGMSSNLGTNMSMGISSSAGVPGSMTTSNSLPATMKMSSSSPTTSMNRNGGGMFGLTMASPTRGVTSTRDGMNSLSSGAAKFMSNGKSSSKSGQSGSNPFSRPGIDPIMSAGKSRMKPSNSTTNKSGSSYPDLT